jgi:ankyrin repeat protein
MYAAKENNPPKVRRLLGVGAVVNAKENLGATPLHRASSEGHVQVVKELREHGSDIEAKTNNGSTPLHWACCFGRLAVVNELLNPSESNGTSTVLGKRKSREADIAAKDNKGNTPLYWASWQDHLPVVKTLLSGGADSRAANNNGDLHIHKAVRHGNQEVSKYLLQHSYATSRRLPLHELLKDLPWIGNPNNDTLDVPPLRDALDRDVLSMDDVVEILEYLVSQNPALLSSRDQDDSLPLHVACRRGASFAIV